MNTLSQLIGAAGIMAMTAMVAPAEASVSTEITYQGQLTQNGSPANGSFTLTFRLYDAPAGGNLVSGPLTANNLPITDGLFTVDLDFGPAAFGGANRWLEIEVGGQILAPRQPVMATPYALFALNGGGSGWLDRGESVHTQSDVGIHTTTPMAHLHINGAGSSTIGFQIDHPGSATGYIAMGSPLGHTAIAAAANNGNRRDIRFTDTGLALSVGNDGSSPPSDNGLFINELGRVGIGTLNPTRQLHIEANGTAGLYVDNNGANADAIDVFASGSGIGLDVTGNTSSSGDQIRLQPRGSSRGLNIYANSSNSAITAWNDGSGDAIRVFGEITFDNFITGIPMINLFDEGTQNDDRMVFAHSPSFPDWGLQYRDAEDHFSFIGSGADRVTVNLNGSDVSPASGGYLVIGGPTGANIALDNNEIMARSNGSTAVLHLNADGGNVYVGQNSSGSGRLLTPVLQITGGSDLAERFDVADAGDVSPQPGMVVSIDPANPGKLVLSSGAYDRTVAGVISGANGVNSGMIMGQENSEADGAHPVALTGRVYVMANAASGAIEPGDLLTTSDLPGHAMKVADYQQAQGAIIGKAMTPLNAGEKGMVLVLVSLQ